MSLTEAKLAEMVAEGRVAADVARRVEDWMRRPALAAWSDAVAALVEADNADELTRLFWQDLPFGTGGRRGVMGPLGTATINERTIAESANGLGVYLIESGQQGGLVAIAHDTRHRSVEFARLTATTLAALGLRVGLFDGYRATPTLAFAIRHLGCIAGVVISASHNPPPDNGFKVYGPHGGQFVAPHDADLVAAVAASDVIPSLDFDQAIAENRIDWLGAEIDEAYVEAVLATRLASESSETAALPAIFTPLHGVGARSILPVLKAAGFAGVTLFGPQAEPDGDFPNVPDQLPNPERPEVFAPAIAEARRSKAVLVMASDPDADRLGVAAPRSPAVDGDEHRDDYAVLSGNQFATVLVDHILRHRRLPEQAYVLSTLVTSPLVATIARAAGAEAIADLLVGFKHIARTIEQRGPSGFVFACEESLGYLAGTYVRDKDGAGAALLVCEMAAELHATGHTLWDRLEELHARHGRVSEFQHAVTAEGPAGQATIAGIMQTLRDSPPIGPGDFPWREVRDYQRHEVRTLPDNQVAEPLPEPDGNLLVFEAVGPGGQGDLLLTLAARPSGTEPKIKFYGFAQQAPGGDEQVALAALAQVRDGLLGFLAEQLDTTPEP